MNMNPNRAKSIFFACSGLGMGNASRIAAILEALVEQSVNEKMQLTLKVAVWGAGFDFLNEFKKDTNIEFEVIKLTSYPKHKSFLKFANAFIRNSIKLRKYLQVGSPDVIILDSDYHWPAYCFLSIPKIFIGQAIDVIERAENNKYKFKNIHEKLNMFFKEKLDAYYQLIISDLILVPTFQFKENSVFKNPKIRNVSLIVRHEFHKLKIDNVNSINKIAVLLSGSEIEKEVFLKLKEDFNLRVFTPSKDGTSFLSHSDILDEFNIIFTQGGLTSISEVIARKIFIVVFPIKNHPEQVLNAIEIQKLGLGMRADLSDLKDFSPFEKSIIIHKNSTERVELKCIGAYQCSAVIVQALSKSL